MSADVRVDCRSADDGWTCTVEVAETAGSSRHDVSVRPEELAGFAPGAADPTALVEESFRFLLEREPREAILRHFAVSEIGRYFPEYRTEIRRRMASTG